MVESAANTLSGRLATVQKIISEILGSDVAFAKDARDLLIDCCVEFITLISSEANDIAEREAKKTIASEHVVKALKDLGFEEYIDQILEVATEHKEHQKVKFYPSILCFSDTINTCHYCTTVLPCVCREAVGMRASGGVRVRGEGDGGVEWRCDELWDVVSEV